VRVGISPFGIWRPGNPAGIVGLDAYASIYADSRFWLQSGWVDYFAPQLYWSIASSGQSFPALLGWWMQQNTRRRHLWPGLASYRVVDGTGSAFSSAEIPSQVALVRQQSAQAGGASGTILYNASSVRTDRGGFATALAAGQYAQRALPPATTWLDATPPAAPTVTGSFTRDAVTIAVAGGADAYWWLVRWRAADVWYQRLVPATQSTVAITPPGADGVDAVVVTAVDRVGNASIDVIRRP
jgi:Glycosyl hydrolase-like 10